MAILLSSCLAPSRAPHPVRPAPDAQPPWESMSAFIALGDPQSALAAYERALASEPAGRESRVLHARLLMIAGRLAEAREELSLLLAELPRDAEVLYQLSVLEGLEGNAAAQRELLERVVSLDPGHADAAAGLGDLALGRDDPEAAAGYFQSALSADPTNLVALLGTAECRFRQKDWTGAETAAGKAIESQPDYPFAYVDRARARGARGDSKGALEDLGRAIALDPSYPWSYIDRGRLYIREARAEEALADFTMAVALGPEVFAGYAYRAELLDTAGRDREAIADYERVVNLRPDYWFAYPPLAALYFSTGDWVKARTRFLEAARCEEDELSYVLLAALASHRAADRKAAVEILEEALPRMPRDSWQWEVARFLLKPDMDLPLMSRAEKERNRAVRARMLFYLAEMSLAAGRLRTAASWLADIDGAGAPHAIETRLARREFARLTAHSQESQ